MPSHCLGSGRELRFNYISEKPRLPRLGRTVSLPAVMDEEEQSERPRRAPGNLEKEEARLWRLALGFLVLLATGLAALSWERLQDLPYHLGPFPLDSWCWRFCLPPTYTDGAAKFRN